MKHIPYATECCMLLWESYKSKDYKNYAPVKSQDSASMGFGTRATPELSQLCENVF